jgi:hypothetical protein
MSKEVMELQVYNTICEAVGCFEKATAKINVKVGNLGSVSLDVCPHCIRKFNGNSNGESALKQKFAKNDHQTRNLTK